MFERTVEVVKRLSLHLAWLGWAYGVVGRTDDARAVLAELLQRAVDEYVRTRTSAGFHAGLGESDAALDCFEAAVPDREPLLACCHLPPFDAVRDDLVLPRC